MATQIGSEAALSTKAMALGRASLGIDGDKAYAVFGPDLQEGEAVFVTVRRKPGEALHEAQRRAAHQALDKLEAQLGCELIYFWTPHAPVERC
ncbi:MAG TPA: hypothetical protein VFS04_04190 [Alphaproteobacteria bacterium]|nr:hypothetical protein [Alphaproteobacteria bacterium]